MSGSGRVQEGDSQHRHGELWIAGVVAAPEGELVGRPTNDNRFVPTADQAVLDEDDVSRLDGGPIRAGKIRCDWLARFLSGFAVRIDGGDDLLVQSSRIGGTIAGPAAWIWPAGSFPTRSVARPLATSITLRRNCLAAARAWSAWACGNQAAWGRQLLSRPNTTTLPAVAALGLATDFWVMTFSGI